LSTVADDDVARGADGAAAQALCDAIVLVYPLASHTRRGAVARRRRRIAFAGLAALVAVAIAVAAGSSKLGTEPARAAVAFHTQDGYIVADVTDPFASADRLRAAFR